MFNGKPRKAQVLEDALSFSLVPIRLDQAVYFCRGRTCPGALDQQGKVDWSQAFLAGSFVPAKKGEQISPMAGRAKEALSLC
jgi:hypothetical protein